MKLLILADIHANLPALEAVLEREKDYDRLLFLGDVVDYGPHPCECIDLLQNVMTDGVLGNHDHAILYDTDCMCRPDFKQYSVETRQWHTSLLKQHHLRFLISLPRVTTIEIQGYSILLAHASPHGELSRYIDQTQLEQALRGICVDILFMGHTHIQYQRRVGSTLVVNPGSVGLARDGGGACYATLIDGTVTLHRISYDVETVLADLDKSPLSESTKTGLTNILRCTKREQ